MPGDALDTEYIKVDAKLPDQAAIEKAAAVLKKGGLVAFPTETVYGLGANALDPKAVAAIFKAKARPADNPLIVHLDSFKTLDNYFQNLSSIVSLLAAHFWPGPLTLVLPNQLPFPSVVTGGLSTVAVRVPDHPVALALLQATGLPLAAPSANFSGRPSPTLAEHVLDDLAGRINLILDGGQTGLGVESTVLDVTCAPPVILRPGGITKQQLEDVIGTVLTHQELQQETNKATDNKPRSPGLKYRHYAPKADLLLCEEPDLEQQVKHMLDQANHLSSQGQRVGILAYQETKSHFNNKGYPVIVAGKHSDPSSVAAALYNALRQFDTMDIDVILAGSIPDQALGQAVMDRLRRASVLGGQSSVVS